MLDRLRNLHRAYLVGGWDVVVFFDFMSIPQNGITSEGEVVWRTQEEQEIFDECLPNMGSLYSLFPVLVLTDVPDGDVAHDYFDSGWCMCEFNIALLANQLHPYSVEELRMGGSTPKSRSVQQRLIRQATAEGFQSRVEKGLEMKHFLHDSDRRVARGIIRGFVARRLLIDSLKRHEIDGARRILAHLCSEGLLDTLHEP